MCVCVCIDMYIYIYICMCDAQAAKARLEWSKPASFQSREALAPLHCGKRALSRN